MRRGVIFLAAAVALPSLPLACAQVGPRALRADTALLEHNQIPEGGVLASGSESRRRTTTHEGSVLATTPSGSGPDPDGAESRDVLQSTDVARTRDYLNGLVEESVSTGDQQLCNLAFLKTHKTGSTTLSSLFYRYGVRHNLKVARHAKPGVNPFQKVLKDFHGRVDIMHLHIGRAWTLHTSWREVAKQYKTIMRDPDNINFVTIFREPRSHLLSYYYYFVSRTVGHKHIEEFLLESHGAADGHWKKMRNPSAGELGIKTQEQLEDFVENDLPKFKLVLLTDRFDEGLMVLRNLLEWRLIDMSYVVLRTTSSKMSAYKKSGKGKGDVEDHPPTFDELSIQAQNKIDELTTLDRAVYEAGRAHFEKTLAPLTSEVEADLARFEPLQQLVDQYLNSNTTSLASDMYAVGAVARDYPPASPF